MEERADRVETSPAAGEGSAPPAVELRGIDKRFGAVQANRDIDLAVDRGSITGIIGENGAGKSTLVSILYGFYTADRGTILIDGEPIRMHGSSDAIGHGIGMVHQHFMLVPTMSVLENVMLGREGGALLARGEQATRERMAELSGAYGLDVDPDALVGELPVGLQQRVEILKTLLRGARILILDEPTGVLTPQEADRLFEILAILKRDGVTILLITHKLREIMAATDAVYVMRRGEMVAHRRTSDTSQEELARLMVGREVLFTVGGEPGAPGAPILAVESLSHADERGAPRLTDVAFELRAGEILGVAGVSGNGQSELLDVLSGIEPPQSGSITFAGRTFSAAAPPDPSTLRDMGLAHIPEDRQQRGLVLPFTASESSILGYQGGGRPAKASSSPSPPFASAAKGSWNASTSAHPTRTFAAAGSRAATSRRWWWRGSSPPPRRPCSSASRPAGWTSARSSSSTPSSSPSATPAARSCSYRWSSTRSCPSPTGSWS